MNTRLKPPCRVRYQGREFNLRQLSHPNKLMTAKGWKGLVAYLQGSGGTKLVPYTKIQKINQTISV